MTDGVARSIPGGLRVGGWRALGLFWVVVALAAGGGGAVLQKLGPPQRAVVDAAHVAEAPATSHAPGGSPEHGPAPAVVAAPARVAPPDPSLLEPSRFPPAALPKVGVDGRLARVVYAGPVPAGTAGLPRVALLISGFGLSDRDSRSALERLPATVSLAVSAYATGIDGLLEDARRGGHELLASIPMEPRDYPQNDEGPRALRTGLSEADNRDNLEWALSRTPGAVGATGASDNGMRGERFAEVAGAFDPAVDEIGRRGLLYVDPRPGRAPVRAGVVTRAVDVVLDDQIGRAEIEAKLSALERIARERGAAIGLAGPLRPATIERIGAWAKTLGERGLVMVPVSAVVNPK